jgi:hypothetical protein
MPIALEDVEHAKLRLATVVSSPLALGCPTSQPLAPTKTTAGLTFPLRSLAKYFTAGMTLGEWQSRALLTRCR